MTIPNKEQFRKITKIGLLGVGALLVVSAIGYFGVYRPIAIHNEKKNFAQAEKGLADLQQQIIAKIGAPTQSKTIRSCGYSSVVYDNPRLSCSTERYLLYENQNAVQATKLVNTVQSLGQGPISTDLGDLFTSFSDSTRGKQASYQNYKKISGIECSIQYNFPVAPHPGQQLPRTHAQNFMIYLGCSRDTISEIFPVAQEFFY